MELKREHILNDIQDLVTEIDVIISGSVLDRCRVKKILFKYQEIAAFIVTQEIPTNVREFLITGQDMAEARLPKEYEPLKNIYKLHSYIKQYCENQIRNTNDFTEILDYLSFALEVNPHNVSLFDYVIERYKEAELDKELINVYKLMFFYLLNPVYFEKMGDIYYKMEEWNNALDAYLTCAESSEEYVEIYKKLANVFEKINDNESRLACLAHAETIEGANGL